MYTGPVEPGSTHDLTAARLHVLPALYRSAWLGMPVLADKGYQGAGIGQGVGKVGLGGWLGE